MTFATDRKGIGATRRRQQKAAAGLHSTAAITKLVFYLFCRYFAAVAAGFLAFAAGLAEDLAATGATAVRSRRFLSRFLACARFRVFSRALSFGIVVLLHFGLNFDQQS